MWKQIGENTKGNNTEINNLINKENLKGKWGSE